MLEEIKKYVIGEINKLPKIYKVLDDNISNLTIKCEAHFQNEIEDDFLVNILIDDNYKIHLIENIPAFSNLSVEYYKEKIKNDFLFFEKAVNKLISTKHLH